MKPLLIAFLLVFANTAFAQNRQVVDSLTHQLAIAKQDTSRVLIMVTLSETYRFENTDSALLYSQRALALAQKIKFVKGESNAMSLTGFLNREQGNFPKAIELTLKALRIAEDNHDSRGVITSKNTLGLIYTDLKDYSKAISYYQQAKKLSENEHNEQMLSTVLQNMGTAYIESNQFDSASHYVSQAHKTIIQLKSRNRLQNVIRNFGRIQYGLGNYRLALDYYQQSLQADTSSRRSLIYNLIAEAYQKISQPDSSIIYAKKGLDYGQKSMLKQRVLDSYVLLVDAYKTKKDFKQAFEYEELMVATKESMFGAGNIKAIQTMIVQDQERQKEIETAKITYQNQLKQYALLAGLGVLLLVAFLLYRNNRQKHQANQVLEKTLSELKTTQNQLIQREKMASLGELTAGIAHEIQNPLNFVNNFSEVSTELVDELKEGPFQKLPNSEKDYAEEILGDLTQNLQKITHHGGRASSIVMGMLEHSRTSIGERQPTDLNALADEYLNLAYQGILRSEGRIPGGPAKHKDFKAELVTNFDLSLPKVEVTAGDMSRVLVNLYNNAFYAVGQRAKKAGADYQPTVWVSTTMTNGHVEIRVKDNGMGIPDAIKAKIFQPFFTTKPTGEGTGLGLSLSYDIVNKGHGGTLAVESVDGEGTEFTITLPI